MTLTTSGRPGDALKEEMLRAAVAAAAGGDADGAAALLERLIESQLDLDARPADLTFHIFATALAKRLDREPADRNLYLRRFDLSQISLFNLLAEKLPLVRLGGVLANEVLASVLPTGEPVALLDVGIGTGQQEVALIEMLARRGQLPSRLRMIAIEPSPTSLQEAERGISRAAAAAGLELDFVGLDVLVETLNDEQWATLREEVDGLPLVINAAFAMHHILGAGDDGPARARQAALERLGQLSPQAVVLVEPNSDHNEPDFVLRFERCWWHFGAVFRLIDRLDAEQADRDAMKLFFAREIEDILANSDNTRAERHEPASRWLGRLEAAGLQPATGFEALARTADYGVSVIADRGYAGLAIDGELVVGVICAGAAPLALELKPSGEGAWAAVTARAAAPLARLRVRDIMGADPATVRADATLADAARVLWESGASDLAVLDSEGLFAGVLSEGDIIRRLLPASGAPLDESLTDAFEMLVLKGRHAATQPVGPLVIRDPVALKPTDDLLLVATEMTARQIRRLPVVDDGGRLVGSVSRADVCRALLMA